MIMIPSLPLSRNSLQLVLDRSTTCACAAGAAPSRTRETANARRAFMGAALFDGRCGEATHARMCRQKNKRSGVNRFWRFCERAFAAAATRDAHTHAADAAPRHKMAALSQQVPAF